MQRGEVGFVLCAVRRQFVLSLLPRGAVLVGRAPLPHVRAVTTGGASCAARLAFRFTLPRERGEGGNAGGVKIEANFLFRSPGF